MSKISRLLFLTILANLPGAAWAQESQFQPPGKAPRVFSLPPKILEQLRDRIAAEKLKDPSLDQLRMDADTSLKQSPLSVINKVVTPPSGDKHDYLSLAPYWWPDPARAN